MSIYQTLQSIQRQRVSDGTLQNILTPGTKQLLLLLPQLSDFDSLEYAWWLKREQAQLQNITVTAVAIGNLSAGKQFCQYTGFPKTQLYLDPTAELHKQLNLYPGLTPNLPGLNPRQNAWVGLFLMCAGIKSPGTLKEVFRGYFGDRTAPQLIAPDETVQAAPLPAIQGKTFNRAGGSGFQRPFELATLRLRNMAESIGNWGTYVPDSTYLTQRGGTFLFDQDGELLYQHRDPGILGFSETMAQPLTFLRPHQTAETLNSSPLSL